MERKKGSKKERKKERLQSMLGLVRPRPAYNDDDCFYCHSWRNNIVIVFGTLSSFTLCKLFLSTSRFTLQSKWATVPGQSLGSWLIGWVAKPTKERRTGALTITVTVAVSMTVTESESESSARRRLALRKYAWIHNVHTHTHRHTHAPDRHRRHHGSGNLAFHFGCFTLGLRRFVVWQHTSTQKSGYIDSKRWRMQAVCDVRVCVWSRSKA